MKNLIIILVIVAAIAVVGAGGYLLGNKGNLKVSYTPSYATPSPTTTPGPTSTPVVDETEAIKTAVRQGLVAEHGPDAASMTITVSKIIGLNASGGASAQAGGGMWLAAKVSGTWKLIWDGNGTISCQVIAPYNFPTSMVPECWDETTSKSVTR